MLPSSDETQAQSSDPTPGQGEGNQEQNVPEYVTRAILDESLNDFRNGIQELLSNNYQGVQRQTDRYQQNVQSQISGFEAQLRDLQAKGLVNMSEAEIRQAVRDDAVDRLIAQGGQPGPTSQEGGQPNQPGQDGNDFANRVTAAAARIEQKYGVTLQEGDPEIAQFEIQKHSKSPNYEDYLFAIQQASAAKAERIKAQGPARAPGILPHSPDTSNPLEGVTDLDQIWSQTSLGKKG